MSTGKKKASEVDLIKEYNVLLDEIPWKSLQVLPDKLKKVGGFLGVKPEEFDIVDPIKRVVNFVGVIVKRLRSLEKKVAALEAKQDD